LGDGAFFALGAVGLVVVGYFLYQQQEDTQILLVKAVNQQPASKGILGEIVDVGGFAAKVAALI
jgi:hypothetical protein